MSNLHSANCTYLIVTNAGVEHVTGGGVRHYSAHALGAVVYCDSGPAGTGATVALPAASGDPCGIDIQNDEARALHIAGEEVIGFRTLAGQTAIVHLTEEA